MSLLSLDTGFAPFVDNYIVILAGRHGAPIQVGPFPRQFQSQWHAVAVAVQESLRHPQTDEERLQLRHIEANFFTAEVCHHRASYLLWRARKERSQRKVVSSFDITRDSIGNEIAEIYQSAKDRLPSIRNDDSDDDDDGTVQSVHVFSNKTKEEVARDQKIAEAEDDLMRKIQELQVEFFDKHRKWVDAPVTFTPDVSPTKKRIASSPPGALEPENFCIENINRKLLIDIQPQDLAVVFDSLDISEHKDKFKRTTGRVLKTLSRKDLHERFVDDKEAADLLWAWIEERRCSAPSSKSSTPQKRAAPGSMEDAARQQVTAMLNMFRSANSTVPEPTPRYLDPLANLKKAMNPNRPLRPSQMNYDDEEALAEMNDCTADDEEMSAAFAKSTGRGGATTQATASKVDPRRGGAPPSSQPAAASFKETAAPTRANRWQVVEYASDEDDE